MNTDGSLERQEKLNPVWLGLMMGQNKQVQGTVTDWTQETLHLNSHSRLDGFEDQNDPREQSPGQVAEFSVLTTQLRAEQEPASSNAYRNRGKPTTWAELFAKNNGCRHGHLTSDLKLKIKFSCCRMSAVNQGKPRLPIALRRCLRGP